MDYSHPKMIALYSESQSKGTGGLMRVDNVDTLAKQDLFGHRVVGNVVRKYDIGCDDQKW